MKTIILLLVSCIALLAADDISVTVTVKTNKSGWVTTKEFFTRAGQTNLLRSTTRTNGVVRSRLYRFYHDRKPAADHLVGPEDYVVVSTHNGFNLHLTSRSNLLSETWIGDKYDNVLDVFEVTNGLLTPIPTSELRKYMGRLDARKLTAPKETGN